MYTLLNVTKEMFNLVAEHKTNKQKKTQGYSLNKYLKYRETKKKKKPFSGTSNL